MNPKSHHPGLHHAALLVGSLAFVYHRGGWPSLWPALLVALAALLWGHASAHYALWRDGWATSVGRGGGWVVTRRDMRDGVEP